MNKFWGTAIALAALAVIAGSSTAQSLGGAVGGIVGGVGGLAGVSGGLSGTVNGVLHNPLGSPLTNPVGNPVGTAPRDLVGRPATPLYFYDLDNNGSPVVRRQVIAIDPSAASLAI